MSSEEESRFRAFTLWWKIKIVAWRALIIKGKKNNEHRRGEKWVNVDFMLTGRRKLIILVYWVNLNCSSGASSLVGSVLRMSRVRVPAHRPLPVSYPYSLHFLSSNCSTTIKIKMPKKKNLRVWVKPNIQEIVIQVETWTKWALLLVNFIFLWPHYLYQHRRGFVDLKLEK